MWRDHPCSQKNKSTESALEVGVGGDRKGGVDKFLKKWGVGNIEGSS